MVRHVLRRPTAVLLAAAALAACDASSDPTAPDVAEQPAVVSGQVSVASSASPSSSADPSGVVVSIDGATGADVTDANGDFRIETRTSAERITLRFRRGAIDVRLELDGVTPGSVLRVRVRLTDDDASVTDSMRGSRVEFHGVPRFVSLTGAAPARVLRVEITQGDRSVPVAIVENRTRVEQDGDLVTFDEIARGVSASIRMKLEGDGIRLDDGSIGATRVKAETEHDGAGDDRLVEFRGPAVLISLTGTAPERTLVLSVGASDQRILVSEVSTRLDPEGDLTTFDALLTALRSPVALRVEGRAVVQDDGALLATALEAEVDEENNQSRHEFQGTATLVSLTGTAPDRAMVLSIAPANRRITVAEAATRLDPEGDLTTFDALLAGLRSTTPVRVEGNAIFQGGGAWLATVLKAETDD